MTDLPILFSTPMVRALIADQKTQTRRLLTPATARFETMPSARYAQEFWQRHASWLDVWADGTASSGQYLHVPAHHAPGCRRCREQGWEGAAHRLHPVIEVGDRLWVREICRYDSTDADWKYAADGCSVGFRLDRPTPDRWPRGTIPSIHLERRVSRLTLTVMAVRVELLQSITDRETELEGVEHAIRPFGDWSLIPGVWKLDHKPGEVPPPTIKFAHLWNTINGKRPGAAWADNPWVIAIGFTVARRNIDEPSAAREHVAVC